MGVNVALVAGDSVDALGLGEGPLPPTRLNPPLPTPGGAAAVFRERRRNRVQAVVEAELGAVKESESPMRLALGAEPSLLEEQWDAALDDVSFDLDRARGSPLKGKENLRV